jgi:SNF2 family DNA or RNA helicase
MKFKKFQFEDIALAALLDGVILSWEPGLGKTLAAIAWALIKDARRVLLVVPGQLHCHFVREAALRFERHITPLQHWRQLRGFGINRPFPSGGCRFFITTYQDLGFNNTRGGDPTLAEILAELGPDSGFDCIIVDEGTRLQSTETHIANGVRMLNPRYRMILTGTPVKNRLESFFWLGWWAAGGSALGNPLWPYEATDAARERFANEHLMRIRSEGTRPARTARITNIHDLWHLLAPLIVRRRKSNCGERIPPKIVRPIRVQPGREQAEAVLSLAANGLLEDLERI